MTANCPGRAEGPPENFPGNSGISNICVKNTLLTLILTVFTLKLPAIISDRVSTNINVLVEFD